MLATLTGIWTAIPKWGQVLLEVVAAVTAYWIVKMLYRREDRRRGVEAYLWLGALLAVNWIWSIPGLLVLVGWAGGLTAWHFAIRADAAEARRRNRLAATIEEYLYAQYQRHLELYPSAGGGLAEDPFRDWLKKQYEVGSSYELLEEWDEQGTTVEDLHRRLDAENSSHANRLAEGKKE